MNTVLLKYTKLFNKEENGLILSAIDFIEKNSDVISLDEIKRAFDISLIVIKETHAGINTFVANLIYSLLSSDKIMRDEIVDKINSDVSNIVSGLLKIPELKSKKYSSQSENFIKLLLTVSGDVRAVLISLAQQIYNMRNIEKFDESEQKIIIDQSSKIFAPMAHRIGLYKIKTELEETVMKYSETVMYKFIARKLEETKSARDKYISDFIRPLKKSLKKEGLDFTIKGRPKSIFSIWRKMKKQDVPFEEVYDLFAIRIILKSRIDKEKSDCWKVYSILTDSYKPNPNRLRDWISAPKTSGYESLHTTVLGNENKWVEVQIRTERMDDIAENGVAAHWKYKETPKTNAVNFKKSSNKRSIDCIEDSQNIAEKIGEDKLEHTKRGKLSLSKNKQQLSAKAKSEKKESETNENQNQAQQDWLANIRQAIENPNLEEQDDNKAKSKLYSHEIFIFTPKGDLYNIKNGYTVLDFAFNIHSNLGLTCTGAIVNDIMKPLSHVLQNGDTVKILTSKNKTPKPDWLDIVKSSRAKNRIKHALKKQFYEKSEQGKEIVKQKLNQLKLGFNDANVVKLVEFFNAETQLKLYQLFGEGKIDVLKIKNAFKNPEKEVVNESELTEIPETVQRDRRNFGDDFLIIDEGISSLKYQFSKCCNPVPGDDIFGFVTVTKGTRIHKKSCPNAKDMISRFPYRIISAEWKVNIQDTNFIAEIHISGKDQTGIVANISKIITDDLKIEMKAISVKAGKMNMFYGTVVVYVKDRNELKLLTTRLEQIKGIVSVKVR